MAARETGTCIGLDGSGEEMSLGRDSGFLDSGAFRRVGSVGLRDGRRCCAGAWVCDVECPVAVSLEAEGSTAVALEVADDVLSDGWRVTFLSAVGGGVEGLEADGISPIGPPLEGLLPIWKGPTARARQTGGVKRGRRTAKQGETRWGWGMGTEIRMRALEVQSGQGEAKGGRGGVRRRE